MINAYAVQNNVTLHHLLMMSREGERNILTQLAIRSLVDFIVVCRSNNTATYCIFNNVTDACEFINKHDGESRLFTVLGFLSLLFQLHPSFYQEHDDLEGILGYALIYGGAYEYRVE